MVRAAERPCRDQAPALGQLPGDGIDLGGLHGFLPGERRQDARQALGQHGFAGTRGTHQQHVVAPGRSDDHGPAGQCLPHHVGKIRHLCPGLGGVKGNGCRSGQRPDAAQGVHHLPGGVGRVDGHAVGTGLGSLGGVFGGHIQGADAVFGGGQRHGQHAGYRAQGAVQRQFTQKGGVLRHILQLAAGREHGQQQRQIVHRAGLAHIGGGQVDRDAPVRELEAQVLDGGTHAVRTFPHGGIRQAYDGKGGQPARNVGLHGHGKAAQAVQAKALCYRIHGAPRLHFLRENGRKLGGKIWEEPSAFDSISRSISL